MENLVKCSVYVLSVLLFVKTFLCFVLSTCLVEVPPEDLPAELKADCKPWWYGWVSMLLNAFGLVCSACIFYALLTERQRLSFISLVATGVYVILDVAVHVGILLIKTEIHTMIILNICGIVLAFILCVMAVLQQNKMGGSTAAASTRFYLTAIE